MKNTLKVFIIALFAVFALSLTACENGAPLSVTYADYVKGNTTYRLTVTQNASKAAFAPVSGDTYVLLIITGTQTQTSSGTVISFSGSVFTLRPGQTTATFTVRIGGDTITAISGIITLENSDGTVTGPDTPDGNGDNNEITNNGNTGGNAGGNGNDNGSGNNEVRTVNSIDELSALLASLPSNTLKNPYLIALNNFSSTTGISTALISQPNKYVSLDLSGSTLTTIPDSAFDSTLIDNIGYNCDTLTGIIIPDSVTSIGGYGFASCINLTSVTIPNSVTSIGDYAFADCESLTSVTIPDSVTNIGEGAFAICGFTGITIPNSVTSIGERAFAKCPRLTAINVDAANTADSSDNGVLYNKDKNTLHTYPSGKTAPSFTIPNSVTSIGVGAFSYCDSLTSITIPDSVTSIGDYAFYYCDSLTSITIPGSVTSIGDYAFYYSWNTLSTVICNATTPPIMVSDATLVSYHLSLQIKVPSTSVAAYKAAAGWSKYADIIVAQ